MQLFAVYVSFGLFVVRAQDEEDAKRVAWEGPCSDDELPASEYGVGSMEDATVVPLEVDGERGLLESHFG